jgi:hypothetical protein
LGEEISKAAGRLDDKAYVSDVSLLESGKPTPAQIEIQEEKERHQQAFQESLEREAKEATDHQNFIDKQQNMIDENISDMHKK